MLNVISVIFLLFYNSNKFSWGFEVLHSDMTVFISSKEIWSLQYFMVWVFFFNTSTAEPFCLKTDVVLCL